MKSVALIGAGNVNWHLGHALNKKYYKVIQVFSRTRTSAAALGKSLGCTTTIKLNRIKLEADIVLIAVHDDAVANVAEALKYLEDGKRLFIHTSGSVPISVLEKNFSLCGVFWPPQTIRKEKKIVLKKTPFVVVANDHSKSEVVKFAKHLSNKIEILSDKQKRSLHLAAVFANNFTNHLFKIAFDICQEQDLDFELLLPIIRETAGKITKEDPSLLQTGPAIRSDKKTITDHLSLLKKDRELKKIYTLLTNNINPSLK